MRPRRFHAPDAATGAAARDGADRPGFVNAHTHLYSGLAPLGMPDPLEAPQNFLEILERVWWRLDRALDPASLRAAARLYVAEALLHGTTALVDHHESPGFIEGSLDVLADACQDLGMRAVLCYGATERNGGRDEAARGLDACRRFVRANARPLVRGVVGLHASFTISDETARAAGVLCRDLDVPLHVHVAEDLADVADARRRGHAGPLERLAALDALPPGSILAHGVHLDAGQVRAAGARGCWLVQNPRSNEHNGVGYPDALREGTDVALGTDGFPADMPAELAALERIAGARPAEAAPGPVGLGRRLEAGSALVASRFGGPHALDGDRIELEPLAPGVPTRARRVTVGGRVVVEHGRLVAADIEAVRAEAAAEAARLWTRLEALP